MLCEKTKTQHSGWLMLPLLIAVLVVVTYFFVRGLILLDRGTSLGPWVTAIAGLALFITAFSFKGLFIVEPNEAYLLLLFGKYKGTEKTMGFRWCNPLYNRILVSLRVRNFDSEKLKVNDKKGNPIEISAVVVWKVNDTAQAIFEVEHFDEYVRMQSESAVRHLATQYPYDGSEHEEISLRVSIDEVSEALGREIQERVKKAGVEVLEARINHLAYAPEIAGAMLQRQQAEAVIAARQKIVDGAVGMVQMALERLSAEGVLALDEERKANMVSNLMVVLCSERGTQPIINTGSLY